MALFKTSVHPYLDQLLQTATKGNVTATYSLYESRMRLNCKICDSQLTVEEPEGVDLDYGVQEFIKIHAHVGGHKDKPKCNCGGPYQGTTAWMHSLSCPVYGTCTCDGPKTGPEGTFGQSHHDWCPEYVYVKPVTLDFKAVGKIDENSQKAETIYNQMSKYEKEVFEKSKHLDTKVLEIKEADAQKILNGTVSLKEKGLMNQEDVDSSKAKLQALKNLLAIKKMLLQTQQAEGALSGIHVPAKPAGRQKVLKIATGRKFR